MKKVVNKSAEERRRRRQRRESARREAESSDSSSNEELPAKPTLVTEDEVEREAQAFVERITMRLERRKSEVASPVVHQGRSNSSGKLLEITPEHLEKWDASTSDSSLSDVDLGPPTWNTSQGFAEDLERTVLKRDDVATPKKPRFSAGRLSFLFSPKTTTTKKNDEEPWRPPPPPNTKAPRRATLQAHPPAVVPPPPQDPRVPPDQVRRASRAHLASFAANNEDPEQTLAQIIEETADENHDNPPQEEAVVSEASDASLEQNALAGGGPPLADAGGGARRRSSIDQGVGRRASVADEIKVATDGAIEGVFLENPTDEVVEEVVLFDASKTSSQPVESKEGDPSPSTRVALPHTPTSSPNEEGAAPVAAKPPVPRDESTTSVVFQPPSPDAAPAQPSLRGEGVCRQSSDADNVEEAPQGADDFSDDDDEKTALPYPLSREECAHKEQPLAHGELAVSPSVLTPSNIEVHDGSPTPSRRVFSEQDDDDDEDTFDANEFKTLKRIFTPGEDDLEDPFSSLPNSLDDRLEPIPEGDEETIESTVTSITHETEFSHSRGANPSDDGSHTMDGSLEEGEAEQLSAETILETTVGSCGGTFEEETAVQTEARVVQTNADLFGEECEVVQTRAIMEQTKAGVAARIVNENELEEVRLEETRANGTIEEEVAMPTKARKEQKDAAAVYGTIQKDEAVPTATRVELANAAGADGIVQVATQTDARVEHKNADSTPFEVAVQTEANLEREEVAVQTESGLITANADRIVDDEVAVQTNAIAEQSETATTNDTNNVGVSVQTELSMEQMNTKCSVEVVAVKTEEWLELEEVAVQTEVEAEQTNADGAVTKTEIAVQTEVEADQMNAEGVVKKTEIAVQTEVEADKMNADGAVKNEVAVQTEVEAEQTNADGAVKTEIGLQTEVEAEHANADGAIKNEVAVQTEAEVEMTDADGVVDEDAATQAEVRLEQASDVLIGISEANTTTTNDNFTVEAQQQQQHRRTDNSYEYESRLAVERKLMTETLEVALAELSEQCRVEFVQMQQGYESRLADEALQSAQVIRRLQVQIEELEASLHARVRECEELHRTIGSTRVAAKISDEAEIAHAVEIKVREKEREHKAVLSAALLGQATDFQQRETQLVTQYQAAIFEQKEALARARVASARFDAVEADLYAKHADERAACQAAFDAKLDAVKQKTDFEIGRVTRRLSADETRKRELALDGLRGEYERRLTMELAEQRAELEATQEKAIATLESQHNNRLSTVVQRLCEEKDRHHAEQLAIALARNNDDHARRREAFASDIANKMERQRKRSEQAYAQASRRYDDMRTTLELAASLVQTGNGDAALLSVLPTPANTWSTSTPAATKTKRKKDIVHHYASGLQ